MEVRLKLKFKDSILVLKDKFLNFIFHFPEVSGKFHKLCIFKIRKLRNKEFLFFF